VLLPWHRSDWFPQFHANACIRPHAPSTPVAARTVIRLTGQAEEYRQLEAQIDEVGAKLTAWHRANDCSRRLPRIPSVGPIGAMLLRMKALDTTQFRSGRQFAAWIGLAPGDLRRPWFSGQSDKLKSGRSNEA
jgi:transposase